MHIITINNRTIIILGFATTKICAATQYEPLGQSDYQLTQSINVIYIRNKLINFEVEVKIMIFHENCFVCVGFE